MRSARKSALESVTLLTLLETERSADITTWKSDETDPADSQTQINLWAEVTLTGLYPEKGRRVQDAVEKQLHEAVDKAVALMNRIARTEYLAVMRDQGLIVTSAIKKAIESDNLLTETDRDMSAIFSISETDRYGAPDPTTSLHLWGEVTLTGYYPFDGRAIGDAIEKELDNTVKRAIATMNRLARQHYLQQLIAAGKIVETAPGEYAPAEPSISTIEELVEWMINGHTPQPRTKTREYAYRDKSAAESFTESIDQIDYVFAPSERSKRRKRGQYD